MTQDQLVGLISELPQRFAWFLGAGTSRTAGLPTATDIIWDLKRKYYCQIENQDISLLDLQNEAVKKRIQSFMDSKGFPALWANNEYTTYFEKLFEDDRERQRRYIREILSEENISLSIGNRVFAALMTAGFCRVAFTTNFDSIVEKAVAEMGKMPLSPYHLEGAESANNALNNEEYPLYCKLHGDFRYDSLKNLSQDLQNQNDELSRCFLNTANRFGFIVVGYSGRDQSVMRMFQQILDSPNPFPNGLFWTETKSSGIHPSVSQLINLASEKGVDARKVEIQTFDILMLRLWRNIKLKPESLDKNVRRSRVSYVDIPIPPNGNRSPLLRLTSLPILSLPRQCYTLSFKKPKNWDDLRQATKNSGGNLIFTKSDTVLCWGSKQKLRETFAINLASIKICDVPSDFRTAQHFHIKSFYERALALALTRNRPLLMRLRRSSTYLTVAPNASDKSGLKPLVNTVGQTFGFVPGVFTAITPEYPESVQVRWFESIELSVELKNERCWMVIDPDIWIWPLRARKDAADFLRQRRANRFNKKFNDLVEAWVSVLFGTDNRGKKIDVSVFNVGNGVENPSFEIGSRTAYTKGLVT